MKDCSCRALLNGFPENPPDHVCASTQMELCRTWIESMLPSPAQYHKHNIYNIESQYLHIGSKGKNILLDQSFGAYKELLFLLWLQSTFNHKEEISESGHQKGKIFERICQLEASDWQSWFPLRSSNYENETVWLLFPIFERIEFAYEPKLDEVLKGGVAFQRQEERQLNEAKRYRQDLMERFRQEGSGICYADSEEHIAILEAYNSYEEAVEDFMQGYFEYHAQEPSPHVRSVTITSFVFARVGAEQSITYEIEHQIEGDALSFPDDMMRKIKKRLAAHQKWVATWSMQPLLPDLRKANTGRPQNTELAQDIALYKKGEITKTELFCREMERYRQSVPNQPLKKEEERCVSDKIRKALKRAGQ